MSRRNLLPAASWPPGRFRRRARLPQEAKEPPKGIALSGSVKKPQAVDAARSPPFRGSRAGESWPGGAYRATVEAEGVALKDLLEKAEVAKATNDNFDRPLDLAVVVTGRDGKKALFSWGELFLAGDTGAAVLADRIRLFMPHHHEPVEDARLRPRLLAR
ncbi:MAG: hypothetical protein IPN03_11265 [Holophagales bacterium]|nr:hypothetical protein [Holophagales bacterium]